MDFETLRSSIAAAQGITYLNTGWSGPSPERVLTAMHLAAEEEARRGPASPDGLAHARQVRDEAAALVGRLLNAAPEDLLLTHGTTEGVNIVLHGLDWQPGDELVTCNLEHPALKAPTTILEQRRGVTVRRVAMPPAASAEEATAAIEQTLSPRTRIVALSHIMFTCGLRLPARRIVEAAHAAGALVLLDGAQTAGHIPLDVRALDVDFYSVSGQKWLFGPTGTGALYIRPDRRELLTPLFIATGLDSRTGLRMHGLASDSTLLTAGFAEALRLHFDLGPAKVEARIMALAQRVREKLATIPSVRINGPTNPATSCGLTAISLDGWEPLALADALWERYRTAGRTVGYPPGLRFSTAPFNNEADVDRAVEALEELAPATA